MGRLNEPYGGLEIRHYPEEQRLIISRGERGEWLAQNGLARGTHTPQERRSSHATSSSCAGYGGPLPVLAFTKSGESGEEARGGWSVQDEPKAGRGSHIYNSDSRKLTKKIKDKRSIGKGGRKKKDYDLYR